ncbi:hypothetical protein [Novacetimonas hansenii]|uniref:hypothetical protein n=1 Tax=Novacetimonas hansenii TaxID=436 RepID=UPI0039E77F21
MSKLPPIEDRPLPVLVEQAKRLRVLAKEMHDTNVAHNLGPKYRDMIQTVEQAAEVVDAEIAAKSQSAPSTTPDT